jgi:hypothetical protein
MTLTELEVTPSLLEAIRENYRYDPVTGRIYGLRNKTPDRPIGSLARTGYRVLNVKDRFGKVYFCQARSVAAFLMTGQWIGVNRISHRDDDRANDAWDNIKLLDIDGTIPLPRRSYNRSGKYNDRIPTEKALELLREYIDLDYQTGELFWRKDHLDFHIGDPVERRAMRFDGFEFPPTRAIWYLVTGEYPVSGKIGHENHKPKDNRPENLFSSLTGVSATATAGMFVPAPAPEDRHPGYIRMHNHAAPFSDRVREKIHAVLKDLMRFPVPARKPDATSMADRFPPPSDEPYEHPW